MSITNQIDANITRTAFSSYVYEYKDFAVGLVDAERTDSWPSRPAACHPSSPMPSAPRCVTASGSTAVKGSSTATSSSATTRPCKDNT